MMPCKENIESTRTSLIYRQQTESCRNYDVYYYSDENIDKGKVWKSWLPPDPM